MMNENISHVIKDPVHGTMQFSTVENNWIKPFIDSPQFQRLRHIKQLGMGDFIFPGAVHTRFNHSLGCSYISSQIAHKIGLSEAECQLVVISCLLHDIGHGPFSHAFEDVFYRKLIRHEDWTPYLLADFRNNDFFNDYNRCNPRHHLSNEKFQHIENMIMHKATDNRVLADIVSSQLDADRLDYLLRDSHFCGVTYGKFDFQWMLNCMTIVNSRHGERLGITHKGIGVIEHYLMARRLMMRNIYHLQKKLALEFFMVKLLQNLAESIDDYAAFSQLKTTRLGTFLSHANQFNQTIKTSTDVPRDKEKFIKQNYQDYKELCDYDVFMAVKLLSEMHEDHPAIHLAKRIQQRQMPKIIRLDQVKMNIMDSIIAEFKNTHHDIADWQINLIQTPHQSYQIEQDPILVVNEQSVVKPINEISLMISAISDKYEHTAFLCIDKAIFKDERVKQLTEKLIQDTHHGQPPRTTSSTKD